MKRFMLLMLFSVTACSEYAWECYNSLGIVVPNGAKVSCCGVRSNIQTFSVTLRRFPDRSELNFQARFTMSLRAVITGKLISFVTMTEQNLTHCTPQHVLCYQIAAE